MRRITTESSCRWDEGKKVGDPGVEYEFDIKMPKLNVDMTNAEYENEAHDEIQWFKGELKTRYKWIGRIEQTGRSGGWLMVQDVKGGATKAKLQAIIRMVESAMKRFIKRLEEEYPAR